MLPTDASNTTIGAALKQLDGEQWKLVGFFPRKLTTTEKNYCTYDRELLAVFAAIEFFQHIVDGRQFIVRTDHRPLIYAFQRKQEKANERRLNNLTTSTSLRPRLYTWKGMTTWLQTRSLEYKRSTKSTCLKFSPLKPSQNLSVTMNNFKDSSITDTHCRFNYCQSNPASRFILTSRPVSFARTYQQYYVRKPLTQFTPCRIQAVEARVGCWNQDTYGRA